MWSVIFVEFPLMSASNRPFGSLACILPYLWPSRKRLFLSFGLAALVACFWGAILSITYPVVKVLLEGKPPAVCVQEAVSACEAKILEATRDLTEYDSRRPSNKAEELSLLRKRARAERKLTNASQRLAVLKWFQVYVVPGLPRDLFKMLALILGTVLVLTVLKLLCMFAEEVLVGSVVQLTVMRIRKACFRRVLSLDYQTQKLEGTPEMMSRFTYDIEALGSGLALLGGKLVREPLKAVACLTLSFWVNWQLTLLSILFAPVAAVAFHRVGRVLKKASQRSMESVARIYKVLEESLNSANVVIAFDGARRHRQRHHRESKQFYRRAMRIVTADALTGPMTELFGMAAVVIAILPGAYLVLGGKNELWGVTLASEPMELAELSTIYTLLAGMLDPIRKLSSIYGKLKRASAAADRVFSLMEARTRVEDPARPKPLPAELKSIEFRDVGFTYATRGLARPIVLDDVTVEVAAGEVLAVVGENGSGKSTLVNLLPRYFDPDRGAVLLNGIDLREFSLRELRRRIGVVPQETLLFDDTIYENIRYGNPAATRAEVEQAAEQAFVTQFFDQMPDGFNTIVGERGASLSGGQRQRIALARAILRNPRILILDEATSAIDALSERLIHKSLESFVRGRTAFIITHSISDSLLALVNRILVLERGKLLATGSHGQLMKQCPVYCRLYQSSDSGAATQVPQRSELREVA
jgi:subfamily B ATP-binding cassette protein MsbA